MEIFISYRRSDSQHAAFAIADRLGWAFGHQHVFFDRSSIQAGAQWPDDISRAINSAKVVLVVIGKNWLRVADEWGRRRLDDPADWVRKELCEALRYAQAASRALTIVPVYLDGVEPPPKEAFDPALQDLDLSSKQRLILSSDLWEESLERLIKRVQELTGLPRINRGDDLRNPNGSPVRPPAKERNRINLTDTEIRSRLANLPHWDLVWSPHVWGTDGYAQQLSRWYEFDEFIEAINFMAYVSPGMEKWKPPHHARWENQWRVVTVFFTTWDIGCRVTELDVKAARDLDELHGGFKQLPRTERTVPMRRTSDAPA